MSLNWSNTAEIASYLANRYSDIDSSSLSRDNILHMINSLPNFEGSSKPPSLSYLDNILWTWARIRDPYFEEKSPYL